MKPCRCCGQLLPLTAFYGRGDNHGDGRKNTCACPHCTPAITDPNERLVAWYEAQAVAA